MRVQDFLILNGWIFDNDDSGDYQVYVKPGLSDICVGIPEEGCDDIVFVSDEGDWLNIPRNIYALIGALLHNRMLDTAYIWR